MPCQSSKVLAQFFYSRKKQKNVTILWQIRCSQVLFRRAWSRRCATAERNRIFQILIFFVLFLLRKWRFENSVENRQLPLTKFANHDKIHGLIWLPNKIFKTFATVSTKVPPPVPKRNFCRASHNARKKPLSFSLEIFRCLFSYFVLSYCSAHETRTCARKECLFNLPEFRWTSVFFFSDNLQCAFMCEHASYRSIVLMSAKFASFVFSPF